MYKCKLQELCQRKSWNLPEYTTIKDGPDHLPRFKAIAVVNGLNFETPAGCKSAKEAQNSVAKVAYDRFNISTPPRGQQSPSALVQPVVPACSSPLAPVPHDVEPVPVSPIPSSLPLPPPELLAPNNSALTEPVHKDMMQPNMGDTTQTPTLYKTLIGSGGSLHMYKNRLQQHAQKRYLSLPVYTCESEGPPHTRRFKSRVSFDGKSYETMEFFPTLKEAEHAVAMVACQMLQIDQSQEDGGLYKNLLQELTQKRGLLCPTYETVRWGPPHRSVFQSIVEIGSSTFRGDEAKNKKQAEMNAATVAYYALTESSLVTECSKASSSMECVVPDNLTQSSLPTETMKRDEFVATEASLVTECSKASSSMECVVPDILTQSSLPTETMKRDEFVATKASLVTECSKASSSMECVVPDNLTQSSLPTETMKRDEFVATEASLVTECSKASSSMECVVPDNLTQSSLPMETMKRDEFVATEETEINAKRVKRSPENETANLPALLPPEVSSAQVEHQPVTEPVSGQHESPGSFCSKTVVFPRKSDFPIPDGASVMPCSDDQWVAYKLEA